MTHFQLSLTKFPAVTHICCFQPGEHVVINNNTFTDVGCYVEALKLDAGNASFWYALAGAMKRSGGSVTINGDTFTSSVECYAQAARLDIENSCKWYALAGALQQSSSQKEVLINNNAFTDVGCCVEALKLDAGNASFWPANGWRQTERRTRLVISDTG